MESNVDPEGSETMQMRREVEKRAGSRRMKRMCAEPSLDAIIQQLDLAMPEAMVLILFCESTYSGLGLKVCLHGIIVF